MAKNKKTKRQKTIADLRRQLSVTQTSPQGGTEQPEIQPAPARPQYSFSPAQRPIPQKTLSTIQTPYITKDLKHTMVVTAGIVLAQIMLYIIMNAHR